MNVAFFSRGRGRGHAVPDIALARELERAYPGLGLRWISYGTGAETLREFGYEVVDLELPERTTFLETQLKVTKAIIQLKPDLVIAHEEFAVPPAARLFDIPNLFITDYFIRPRHIWMRCLRYADKILFIDDEGYFAPPPFLKGKIDYAGPFIRPLDYSRRDRDRARRELGFSRETIVILVISSAWLTETRAPIFDLVQTAFRSLPAVDKKLVWIAGDDAQQLEDRASLYGDVIIRRADPKIDRWMSAADVAITKGTRKTCLELDYLGIPSISLSFGVNKIDDLRVAKIKAITCLNARKMTSEVLAERILGSISSSSTGTPASLSALTGFKTGAKKLADWIGACARCAGTGMNPSGDQ